MGGSETGGVSDSKAAKRRARKARAVARAIADGNDFASFTEHQKFS